MCHSCYGKGLRVEHEIRVILKKSTVIRKCHQSADLPRCSVELDRVSHLYIVVFCKEPVDGDLVVCLGHSSRQHADLIDLAAVRVDPISVVVYRLFFYVRLRIQLDVFVILQSFDQVFIRLFFEDEMTVFDIVFFKALIVGSLHASACH